MLDKHYLTLLSKEFPTIQSACTEIINLKASISLPKGTEFFFSDLHGEHEAFIHLLRSASGVIRKKTDELFDKQLTSSQRSELVQVIYYPEIMISKMKKSCYDFDEWCKISLYRLIEICSNVASKYSRSKVRKMLPNEYAFVIDELLHADESINKEEYYEEIINTIISIKNGADFICQLANIIVRLTIDMLHIIGDIYDRGPHADKIMDEIMGYHDVDIQWGNHDISWMGAAAGNQALIANVIRLGISYNNFDQLEDGYGINLRPLSDFSNRVYKDDPCDGFLPHLLDKNMYDPIDAKIAAKMHKAISIIQFKLEAQLYKKYPDFHMNDRPTFSDINFNDMTISLGGKNYPLKEKLLPTIDPNSPLELSDDEKKLMTTLTASFKHSERLNKHMRFLYNSGGMYKKVNSNLLYHGCIPMTLDGEFDQVEFFGNTYKGKDYLEFLDTMARIAYFADPEQEDKQKAVDLMWYLWCGKKSPIFGKSKMSAFEKYFIGDKSLCHEEMNPYYKMIEKREMCEKILKEFGLDPQTSHIVNGHVPIKISQGESPIKAGGMLFIIDGGISKAYQKSTGIGGYTFISNSRYLALAQHQPFVPIDSEDEFSEIKTTVKIVEVPKERITVINTDQGQEMLEKIYELIQLVGAYRNGTIKERA